MKRYDAIKALDHAYFDLRGRQQRAKLLLDDVRDTRKRALARQDIIHAIALAETIAKLEGEVEGFSYGATAIEISARYLEIEAEVTAAWKETEAA